MAARATILSEPTNAGTSVVTSLSIGTGSKLDINDNALIVNYTGASPEAAIRAKIIEGRGGVGLGNGTWTGNGITSSAAAAANALNPESRSVGYANNGSLPLGAYTTFRGQPLDATSVVITFTVTADADLDGKVDDDDVTITNATYAPGVAQPHWALGDFDYNNFVDDDDVTLVGALYKADQAFSHTSPAPATDGGRRRGPRRGVCGPGRRRGRREHQRGRSGGDRRRGLRRGRQPRRTQVAVGSQLNHAKSVVHSTTHTAARPAGLAAVVLPRPVRRPSKDVEFDRLAWAGREVRSFALVSISCCRAQSQE